MKKQNPRILAALGRIRIAIDEIKMEHGDRDSDLLATAKIENALNELVEELQK